MRPPPGLMMQGSGRPQTWRTIFTEEGRAWARGLGAKEARQMAVVFDKLTEAGPALGRPFVDTVKGSRHHNMKELRSVGGNLRALVAFDPRRRAIVLVGGDKTNNWERWYRENIPRADRLYDQHLRDTGGGGASPSGRQPHGRSCEGR